MFQLRQMALTLLYPTPRASDNWRAFKETAKFRRHYSLINERGIFINEITSLREFQEPLSLIRSSSSMTEGSLEILKEGNRIQIAALRSSLEILKEGNRIQIWPYEYFEETPNLCLCPEKNERTYDENWDDVPVEANGPTFASYPTPRPVTIGEHSRKPPSFVVITVL
ncbi:hypothetical protein TNCV_2937391 [Trichonephila clavipes]|nr:hypothetical protein TNCV_2937391 [Trichonephila clavipes]